MIASYPPYCATAKAYISCITGTEHECQSKKKHLRKLVAFFSYAICGDMNPDLAQSLLDDLSTEGHKLHSARIDEFGPNLLTLLQLHSPDIPVPTRNHLNCW